MKSTYVHVVGGGLAGAEAAWALANAGLAVRLHEMRPVRMTDAHKTEGLAELVCSNSFRSDDWTGNAVGLLHEEMRRMGSLVMACAGPAQVPAGAALAVDRDVFSAAVTRALEDHPLITIIREEITDLAALDGRAIVATGPLTSEALATSIRSLTNADALAFFDAIAPIVHADSLDFSVVWRQSRYDKEGPGGDAAAYVNCPFNKEEYDAFVAALLAAPKAEFKDWEKDTPYFEGCLPIEVMAERGVETLRHGPMKPVGLRDPRTGKRPWAVVQLRQENRLGTLFNLVGFQTKLKHGAQQDIFRMIPGLKDARFARLGGVHRNTFLQSPALLDEQLRLKSAPHIRFAGQITGVEGYVESAAIGLLAGRFAAAEARGEEIAPPPPTTALGALIAHVAGLHGAPANYQPMNVNFGLFPEIEATDARGRKLKGPDRKRALAERALGDLAAWLDATGQRGAEQTKLAREA
ncbi:MAG: methylenetetrahydrofolate--tRNA-(uracil(54)-C(5))-methyltransferase (FADH(2)-oxidizing) TrmFO [Hyphomonadaceae bacterium]|nr:methylenetetrahydrofolate--tRNA-(uracil(54)-C(5))-methyltransferase (FADH(2)-oxidizing) TrmFO [Hyphomonadaceae bacterium]